MMPIARKEGLLFTSVGKELVVYEVSRHRFHHLNATAAAVWQHCDGRTPVEEIVAILRGGPAPGAGEETAWTALDLLDQASLLVADDPTDQATNSTRRRFLRTAVVGGSSLAAAMITTMVAPTSAAAQSVCRIVNQSCCLVGDSERPAPSRKRLS